MLRADLALYDRYRQLVALVEVKSRPGTSKDWAAKFRRNILSHGDLGPIRYFLIVTPDWLFLWKQAERKPDGEPDGEPDYAIDVRSFLRPYLVGADPSEELLPGPAFELVVGSWLADLMSSRERSPGGAEARTQLVESGLVDAIEGGRVKYDLAA
jgi:hypothetical protein